MGRIVNAVKIEKAAIEAMAKQEELIANDEDIDPAVHHSKAVWAFQDMKNALSV